MFSGGDKKKIKFLDKLLEFLPNVEEMLKKSADTCLLQYAITTDAVIRSEALKQAAQFRNRLFFNDA